VQLSYPGPPDSDDLAIKSGEIVFVALGELMVNRGGIDLISHQLGDVISELHHLVTLRVLLEIYHRALSELGQWAPMPVLNYVLSYHDITSSLGILLLVYD
jgi:hypothetical protein